MSTWLSLVLALLLLGAHARGDEEGLEEKEEKERRRPAIGAIDNVCLGCICEAASGCNRTSECVGEACGPFRITWAYWFDAGKPLPDGQSNSANGYQSCASDVFCSARAFQSYMNKYAQDCNADERIDCDDYARIHYLGGYGCSGSLPPAYESRYRACKREVLQQQQTGLQGSSQ